jgi:hypothetical protein
MKLFTFLNQKSYGCNSGVCSKIANILKSLILLYLFGGLLKNSHAGIIGFHGDPRLQETTVGSEATTAGVFGASDKGAGVMGYSRSTDSFGVIAFGGLRASAMDHPLAGEFNGNVQVNGDLFLPGADCAEIFRRMCNVLIV